MPLKIVRNNIINMDCDAIVNTANAKVVVGEGCDLAIYEAAGYDNLLSYRRDCIGEKKEGEAFITPGFNLTARHIIHTVSPFYIDGMHEEEERLRECYRNSLQLADRNLIKSIAFPLIATGSFMFPREEGLRIAIDEIDAFLMSHDMLVYIVVYDDASTGLGKRIFPNLNEYIDSHYVNFDEPLEYLSSAPAPQLSAAPIERARKMRGFALAKSERMCSEMPSKRAMDADEFMDFESVHQDKLKERLTHMSDTFSQYLLYLIEEKGLTNADVYKRAIVDKKVFSKIKNNPEYHPQKITAMCLCVGAMLNLDETKDLLARAGYALSPCDKTDILFSYFIENEIYDMIELDIQLEEMGLKCLIS